MGFVVFSGLVYLLMLPVLASLARRSGDHDGEVNVEDGVASFA